MQDYTFLLGKTCEEIREYANRARLTTRIVNEDNVPLMLTNDYNPTRLNLSVESGVVTEIIVG